MKKVILVLILIFTIFLVISIVYLSSIGLPTRIKTELTKILEERLERKFEIQEIKFNLFKGIHLDNLVMYDNPKYSKTPFINVKQVYINISWLSLLLQRKFIVTSININKAELKIIRLGKNLWNFSELINQKSKKDDKKPSFIVYRINISNSKLFFEDKTFSPSLSEIIEDLSLKVNLSLALDVRFNLEAKIKNKEPHCLLYSNGSYSIKNKKLLAYIKVKDALLNEYYPYFKIGSLQLKKGKLQDSDLNLVLENRKLQILTKAKIDDLDLQREQIEFLGALNLDANFNYDPNSKDKLSFSGNINMEGGSIKGVAYLNSIENITGIISFNKDKIQTENLKVFTLNCPIELSGLIENFRNPAVRLNINSDVKLPKVIGVIPEKFKSNFSEINGDVKLKLDISGFLRSIKTFEYTGKAKISDASVKLNLLPEKITAINADIEFNKDKISWQNLCFAYKDVELGADGSMQSLINPLIHTSLKSDSFDLNTKIKMDKNSIAISKLKGSYLNSTFDITGSLDTTEKENPLLSLNIASVLRLEDLKTLPDKFDKQIEKVNPEGMLSLKGDLVGRLKNWKNWQLNLKGNSTQISLFGYKLNDASINYAQKETLIKDFNIKSTAYDGSLTINANVGLSDNLPYLINARLSNLNLAKLILDTPLKEKPISGIFSSQMQLNGNALEASTITGNGALEIKDGNLWELNLLKGLGKLLSITEYNKIVFNAAQGNFTVKNKAVHTENLKFISDKLNLACEGNMDFEKNLDFLIAAQFSDEIIEDSIDLRKVITSAIGEVSKIVSIKLTGNIQKPKYSIILKPIDYFKKLLKGFGLEIF